MLVVAAVYIYLNFSLLLHIAYCFSSHGVISCSVLDYICISAVQLNTFSRLLHDQSRFGREDKINTPIVSMNIYESENILDQIVISNTSNVKITLYFTDVCTCTYMLHFN